VFAERLGVAVDGQCSRMKQLDSTRSATSDGHAGRARVVVGVHRHFQERIKSVAPRTCSNRSGALRRMQRRTGATRGHVSVTARECASSDTTTSVRRLISLFTQRHRRSDAQTDCASHDPSGIKDAYFSVSRVGGPTRRLRSGPAGARRNAAALR